MHSDAILPSMQAFVQRHLGIEFDGWGIWGHRQRVKVEHGPVMETG